MSFIVKVMGNVYIYKVCKSVKVKFLELLVHPSFGLAVSQQRSLFSFLSMFP